MPRLGQSPGTTGRPETTMMTPLTQRQIAHLRQLLERRHELLSNDIREVSARSEQHPQGELADVPDTGDRSVNDLLIDLDNAELHRDVEEIRDIEAALNRMEKGSYGLCSDCGYVIDYERLAAFPSAKRCLQCQAQHEKTHMSATPSL